MTYVAANLSNYCLLRNRQAVAYQHACQPGCMHATDTVRRDDQQIFVLQGAPQLVLSHVALQGATFDGSRLGPLTSESPISNVMPPVALAWVPRQMQDLATTLISIPLYSESERRTVIANLQLPVVDATAKQQYLLAGVAASLLI